MGEIDRASPMPLWAQLLADLRERLDRGDFDERFPTDAELTGEYDLSRHTVREALRRLQDEGLITRERGRGTFVSGSVIEQPSGALYSLFRSLEEQGIEQRSEVRELGEEVDAAVAARLDLPARTKLVKLARVRYADGTPLAHDTAWLPAELARPLLEVDFSHTALYDQLTVVCGIRPTAGTEWVHAVMASPTDRELLGVDQTQALFAIERLTLAGDRPVEWRTTVVRGDRYSFVTRWSPAQAGDPVMEPRPAP